MRSPKEPLRQCKRQYFQYRHINKYSKQETIRRFNDDIFSATDQCGAFKIQFRSVVPDMRHALRIADRPSVLSQKNWNTAAAQWEEEWKIGTGGPPEEAWTEMSGLRLWYDGDRPLFHLVPAVPWYQPEYVPQLYLLCLVAYFIRPDKVRFRRTEEVQSARGIQLYAFRSIFLDEIWF